MTSYSLRESTEITYTIIRSFVKSRNAIVILMIVYDRHKNVNIIDNCFFIFEKIFLLETLQIGVSNFEI